jgi:heme-degrading monooxygenase HmoA
MIARNVTMHLKANSVAEFKQTLEKEVIPLLRKQKGFQDEITFTGSGGRDAVGISFWDTQENAHAYSRGSYKEVEKLLAKVLDGVPQVHNWDVCNSTCHKVAAALAA